MQLHSDGLASMADPGKKALRSWRRLEKAHALVSAGLEAALAKERLPPLVWLRALEEIERHGEDGVRPFLLQPALALEQPAVSRLLDKMVAAALLERRECPQDRRGWTVLPTAAGKKMREQMAGVYTSALEAQFLAHVSDKQARSLDEILGDLLDATRA